MRERKFKAWDENNKSWVPEDRFLIHPNGAVTAWDEEEREVHVVLIEFTGLKDRNGVDIFEWDIVTSCHYNYYTKDHVLDRADSEEHNMQKGIIEWVTYNCSFMIMKRMNSNFCDQWNNSITLEPVKLNNYEIEVIGNIYEHPHLLNERKDA